MPERREFPGVRRRIAPRARRMTLRIDSMSGAPVLTLPPGLPEREIARFLDAQHDWIAARLAEQPPRRRLAPGSTLPLRGTDLAVVHDPRFPRRPQIDDGKVRLGGPEERVEARLLDWLRAMAREDLAACVAAHARALDLPAPPFTLRDTRSRWGSCSARGRLNFSWRLICAPPDVLDYVAAHEVAHLREMNHSPRFWSLVDRLVDHASASRAWLRTQGRTLLSIGPPASPGTPGAEA